MIRANDFNINMFIWPAQQTPTFFESINIIWTTADSNNWTASIVCELTSSVRCVSDHRENVLQDIAEIRLVETLSGCLLLGHILQQGVQNLQTWAATRHKTTQNYSCTSFKDHSSLLLTAGLHSDVAVLMHVCFSVKRITVHLHVTFLPVDPTVGFPIISI